MGKRQINHINFIKNISKVHWKIFWTKFKQLEKKKFNKN